VQVVVEEVVLGLLDSRRSVLLENPEAAALFQEQVRRGQGRPRIVRERRARPPRGKERALWSRCQRVMRVLKRLRL
jgi:hypothetical protein